MSKRRKYLTEEEILQMLAASDSELSDLSDDEDIDKTYEPQVLEEDLSSEEHDGDDFTAIADISVQENRDRPSTSKSPEPIDQSLIHKPLAASTKVKKKKKSEVYQWNNIKFNPVPHPGPLDFTQIQTPDTVRTPLQYFRQYFQDEFFKDAADFTNQYSITKSGKSLKTDARELKVFVAANLIMGCVTFSRLRMYWQAEYKYPPVSNIISRDRFLALRNAFHVVDINNPPGNVNENKLWKIQPVIDAVRKVCLSLPRDNVTYSIDEQMIPFTGRCSLKQYVKNKPRPVGLKNFVLCTSSGLVMNFEIYQGKSTSLFHQELGLGPSVILRLVQTLPQESFVYFDRYFSTLPLFKKLSEMHIYGTGTIMGNHISGLRQTEGAHMDRGTCIEHVSEDKKLAIVEWKDSNKVIMASNCCGMEPVEKVKRWSKTKHEYIEVPCPTVVINYNRCMGGVDICDQQMECYRTWFKTKKWTWKVILHFLDLAVVNSWFQYRRDVTANKTPKKNQKDLLKFKLEVAEALLAAPSAHRSIVSDDEESDAHAVQAHAVKRSKYYHPPAKIPCEDKRYDGYNHFPHCDDISRPRKCRYENCKSESKTRCEKCDVYLCLSKTKTCFKDFHCT
ncbi:piggyBac transposable element-derived protein 3 [Parasteatoda tepidariorum]|uniref:piggyBac transposable element-derived protein 3 n=1 Tax=Parasteatoda tepidariorum TaxID=114398 RepID=UPI001C72183E|nr:piggyBac transposable element-derived protein 3 [Parasteatoda tepidariorum]